MPEPNPDLELLQSKPDSEPDPNDTGEEPDEKEEVQGDNDEEELDKQLSELCRLAEVEDEDIRYRLIRIWKRNEYYFNNIQKIFWDESARDYRTIDSAITELAKFAPADDIKTVNVYRAFIESLVAALAVEPPNIDFPPEDADDPDDVETSESYGQIAWVVSNHSEAPLKMIKALLILMNQGVLVGYNYYKSDPAYGTIRNPTKFQKKETKLSDIRCPKCSELQDVGIEGEVQPEMSTINCQNCGYQGPPKVYIRLDYQDEATEWDDTPKGRSGYDLFGPTYAKLPLYARSQEHCGYCRIALEDNVAKFKAVYQDDEIEAGGGDTTKYERWGRIPPEYYGQLSKDLTTVRYYFFRPWFYYTLPIEAAQLLEEKYPEGVMVTMIGDKVLDKQHQKFDECLTISFDPRANFVHAEPLGNAIIPIQDAKNDIFNLGIQSIEFGIPETFAHPKTVNFQKYKQQAAMPGALTPAMPSRPDKSLGDDFFTLKTATLSNEYIEFDKGLDGLGQFISGAFPSIYGGGMDSGSKTATEYTESRSRALQRLQITWQMFSVFWRKMIAKCVIDYAKNLQEDEQFTKKQNGTYVNVWVRKASLTGKVGHVNTEVDSSLPLSWAQQRDFVMNLMQMNVPQVGMILLHPNNSEFLKRVTGIRDIYIPGENDRNKQFAEFYSMAEGRPAQIDINVDDHQVHMLVLKNILVSPVGTALYEASPQFYQMCIKHYQDHELATQAKTQEPAQGTPAGQPPPTSLQTKE